MSNSASVLTGSAECTTVCSGWSPTGGGLRRAHGFAGRFGGVGRQLDRVIGHLFENVELSLELADPGSALVLLELRRRDGRLQRFVQRARGLVGDAAVMVA